MGFIGITVFIFLAIVLSNNKKKIPWKLVLVALLMQFVLAVLILGLPAYDIDGPLQGLFFFANDLVQALIDMTLKGTQFVFGDLANIKKNGFIMAIQVLPTIVFISALMSVLYHLKIMDYIIRAIAVVMKKLLGVSGAESLGATANIFVGQTEAPLVVKPFIKNMTGSELFSLMVGGMASVAGAVLIAYVSILDGLIENIAAHLITASVLSAPAALMVAKVMYPETETPETYGDVPKHDENLYGNVIEAAASGTSEGLHIALNIGAMLVAFTALIYLLDRMLIGVGEFVNFSEWGGFLTPDYLLKNGKVELSLSMIFSWIFAPMAYLMGISVSEIGHAGVLLGEKIMVNEFVAYLDLAKDGASLSHRTQIILSYALCGFANFASIGIQVGGIGSLAESRKSELAAMGIRSVIGGSLAAFITACIAGIFIA